MAEPQKKASSPIKSKEKTSLLDMDFDKDFLGSWESVTVKDNPVDFDFEASVKGKNKTFNFDKLDMDFNLDGDLDKMSAFKLDISDLDISSPPKKAGISKQKTKEEFSGLVNQVKDQFAFPFDFSELDNFSFETNFGKGDKKSNIVPDGKGVSCENQSPGPGVVLNENIVAAEDETGCKLPAPCTVGSSKLEALVSSCKDLDFVDRENLSIIAATGNNCSKAETIGNKIMEEESRTPEKSNKAATGETGRENGLQRKIEKNAQVINQDNPFESACKNDLSGGMTSKLQMEVHLQAKEGKDTSGLKTKVNDSCATQNTDQEKTSDYLPPECMSKIFTTGKISMPVSDNTVTISDVHGAQQAPAKTDSEDMSVSGASESVEDDLVENSMSDIQQKTSKSKIISAQTSRDVTIGKLMQTKEKGTGVVRSKFFMKSDEAEGQPEGGSIKLKLPSISIKRGELTQRSVGDGRRFGVETIVSKPEKNVASIPRLHSDTSQLACGKGKEGLKSNGENNPNGAEKWSKLISPSNLTDMKKMKGNVPRGDEKNNVDSTTIRPISSKNLSQSTCVNPGPLSLNMPFAKNQILTRIEGSTNPLPKARGTLPDLSGLKISRSTESKLHQPSLVFPKGTKSLREIEQIIELPENIAPKMIHPISADKQTQSPLSLKRKKFQASDGDTGEFIPFKRVSPSPKENRKYEDPSKKLIDPEIKSLGERASEVVVDCQSSISDIILDVETTEIPLELEKDDTVEKAEGYAKSLEDICYTLKKKLEDAKELLCRAIVNNNNLLLINHPMNDDKIRRTQKLAAQLMSKHCPNMTNLQLK